MSHMMNPLQVSGSGWTPAPFTAHISEKEVSELKSKQDIKKSAFNSGFLCQFENANCTIYHAIQ